MSTLTEFLRQQKKTNNPQLQAKRKREWLDTVNSFFQQIRSWLAEAEKDKLIKISPGHVELTEETLGTYSAPILTLMTGPKTVKLRPIGSTIIGADGRVDMESPNGVYMFLYLADGNKWVHGVGKSPTDFPELTEELFTNLLMRALA
ncbi:MAG: hypothetical protein VST67_01630 [Nitrospirota bacterium]|nr:hypothetical protein [Nitrospirota bacterium]